LKFFVDDKVGRAAASHGRLFVLYPQTVQCDLRAIQPEEAGRTLRTCHPHHGTAHSLVALTAENDVLALSP